MFRKPLVLAALATVAFGGVAEARDQIRIVGSSTVFPFSTVVAEQFGKTSSFKTPIIESTGSGGGLKLFCAGVGDGHPDIANSSRRIKDSEVKLCAGNGVTEIVEVKIGYDGIVIANSMKAKPFNLTLRDVYLALAKDIPAEDGKMRPNPHQTWKQVNKDLPDVAIHVLGPPPTSGTRDAFVELAMEGGCKTFEHLGALSKSDEKAFKAVCHTIREDGAFIEAGENDNLIVQKLAADLKALGIFGYSFLAQNADKVQGSVINGEAPTFENIAAAKYKISRPLFFYVKKAHMDKVAGIREFINEFTSDKTWGDEGYLADKGLIPMSKQERDDWRKKVKALANLVM
ncbi:MAG: phosphate ABC transporter substrate-binding protein [Rhodospirillales bacterium RIFCSPLOWO2_12_FULL_58_28]|nr:MAG: phosphate ABC transporter substrate-binding protein [Rhodospirillales bacterium RIFCSPLOWO2_02_FULL_58_16]OHC77699.1 MAG: phosphate ABC transporter substrate-binding protein [Rhodospirillales bacterium RIFCSPLOWO2_12_FULL_58_28]